MPNTVPASAPALPNRRTALLASLAGLATGAALPALASTAPCSDPIIAELAELYAAAVRQMAAADEACDAAEKRVERIPYPETLFVQDDDPLARCFTPARYCGGREWFGDEERIAMLRRWTTASLTRPSWGPVLARRAEVLAAYDVHEAAVRTNEDLAGFTEAEAARKAAWEVEKAIRLRIIDYRSSAPEALRLKVRVYLAVLAANDWRAGLDEAVASGIEAEGGPWEDAFAASIVRDLVTAHQEAARA